VEEELQVIEGKDEVKEEKEVRGMEKMVPKKFFK